MQKKNEKYSFRAHPLMTARLLKPFLFVLLLPVIKGLAEYFIYKKSGGILIPEITAAVIILFVALLRRAACFIEVENGIFSFNSGFILKRSAKIAVHKISSVTLVQNPADVLFRTATCRINTEAGIVNKTDFEIKLSLKNAKLLFFLIFGQQSGETVKFSPLKIAVMSAATSSAVSGLLLAVPLINKAGKLLGVALSELLFDEINNVSAGFDRFFPPAVTVLTVIFVAAYVFSFFISLFKNMRFRLKLFDDMLETESGFFVRKRTVFLKRSVNNLCVEQTALMRLFGMFSMRASVGGYGDGRGEKADIVPCAAYSTLKRNIKLIFSFSKDGSSYVRAYRNRRSRARFLFVPRILAVAITLLSVPAMLVFPHFDRFVLFLSVVLIAVTVYYADLCLANYRRGRLQTGERIYICNTSGFKWRELYFKKEKTGIISFIRTPADIKYGTCKVRFTVRSQSADTLKVRNIDFSRAAEDILTTFDISGINL